MRIGCDSSLMDFHTISAFESPDLCTISRNSESLHRGEYGLSLG